MIDTYINLDASHKGFDNQLEKVGVNKLVLKKCLKRITDKASYNIVIKVWRNKEKPL